jgi:iron complex transport system substrate-binding protein
MTAAAIDRAVSERVAAEEPIYTLDAACIRAAAPDLILAQDLCAVCAVPSGQVEAALDVLGCRAQVVSLDPGSLDDVIACIGLVGAAADRTRQAEQLMADLRERVTRVRTATAGLERSRVLALEWSDPPFNAGHWVPEMIEASGGDAVLTAAGQRSRRLSWSEIDDANADLVALMPCGYSLDESVREGRELAMRRELASVSEVWALAGDAYFSRPGPRVVDGIELLASILHPDLGIAGPPDGAERLR